MREINHPIVFWQSWWFLCAVLKANVPGAVFACITWNTPVQPLPKQHKIPFFFGLMTQKTAPRFFLCSVLRRGQRHWDNPRDWRVFPPGILLTLWELGDSKCRFQGEFGETWIEKKQKLKYIFFEVVHLDEILLYLCRITPNTGEKITAGNIWEPEEA